ncbi:MAG TPA: GntR family transcriptional regulator [Candidatus Coprenecus stercoravium]|uniref:GntR family transcriptional regulator n=1 Tax=Candidatus Coprenecus stercoravium TaxID=2840735 RepID=A0A9D2GRW3_9BACT|nr:GntR family transcriptional regulator [Candidatus Coprenecus stercoravium]HIZ86585.1 GntR family transcriptional regulator [Candidatus Coprenecus pullistercoris]
MEFNQHKPIYLQIADTMCERILTGTWPEGGRIPSVRELGVSLEVNPNTAARSYDELSQEGIIHNKRGIGYFVSPGAKKIIRDRQRNLFLTGELKEIFRKMDILGISFGEIEGLYRKYISDKGRQL